MASCGEIVRENGTYFVNPNHPSQVKRSNEYVCLFDKISNINCSYIV